MLACAALPAFPAPVGSGQALPMGDPRLRLVRAEAGHLPWLRALYRQSRWREIEAAGWDTAMGEAFLDQQFALQHLHYVRHFAGACYWLVTRDEVPCGRLYVDLDPARHLLIDILLDQAVRGGGIGTQLLTAVKASATAHACPLDLHVQHDNAAARRLYAREGFTLEGETPTHHLMRWHGPVS